MDGFSGKLDTDGGFGIESEGVVDVAAEEVGFADSGIASNDYFEEIVKFLI